VTACHSKDVGPRVRLPAGPAPLRVLSLPVVGLVVLTAALAAPAQQRSYRLPGTDLKERVIWGATCPGPEGVELAFGGQDQAADDGQPHTRLRIQGEWQSIAADLRARNPLQKAHDRCQVLARRQKDAAARVRRLHFAGLTAEAEAKRVKEEVLPLLEPINRDLSALAAELKSHDAEQARYAARSLEAALEQARHLPMAFLNRPLPAVLQDVTALQIALEKTAEALDAEPPPRALAPLAYDRKSNRFVLFGGDHLDYLTNDTWTFDPTEKKWRQHHPQAAPPPRANHTLKATGDGKVVLSGGYTYTSNTDYMGGQYRDLGDGDWTYDLAANTWAGGRGVAPDERVYRTGPFHPDFYLQGPKPDAAAFAARLGSLPANTWVMTAPPRLPRLNRDWGTAVLDPDRDLILRFSGGHCAHGGTDVLHFHLASNRWELPFPVEFPLGQLYANTSYPDGFNFNLRPWITGHSYQNYGYDPLAHAMLFTGRPRHTYVYNPDVADWEGRFPKPKGMTYDSCFYTLTLCPTPRGLVCWTQAGDLFRFQAERKAWTKIEQRGGKMPGSVVDNSTIVHDSKRNRLLCARKGYGDRSRYDGELHTLDLETGKVGKLLPGGMAAAAAIPYLCQLRYDARNDLILVGATLPPDDSGLRRTPAYDCSANRWVSLKIGGDDPSGKTGRNVSLGLMYDARRNLFWAVDTDSKVYVLRLEPSRADPRPLE
jgi:hypothetical protein